MTELNGLLRKSPRIETIVDGDIEYSSDEELDPMERMNMERLQRLEATDSQIPYPVAENMWRIWDCPLKTIWIKWI